MSRIKMLQPKTYDDTKLVNHEGFPTYQMTLEEAYLQCLLTNVVGDTFYVKANDLVADTKRLHAEMVKTDPDFMAKALVYARNEGMMKLQPIYGLSVLARHDAHLFKIIFNRIIQTPADLSDFVELMRSSGGMGRMVKTAVQNWLNGMGEYHAIKYASGGQGYSLRDVLRVIHPKPVNPNQDLIFKWLAQKEKWEPFADHTPQIKAFEDLKKATDPNEQLGLIEKGKLPYEVVTGAIKPDVKVWSYLMRQMPYMALLRHLNTLQRAGVFQDAVNVSYAAQRLSDVVALRKAKVLPFRLFMAYQMFEVEGVYDNQIRNALVDALEHSSVNMPNLDGKVCIAPDVSGSMDGSYDGKSKTRYIDIAGIFCAALMKRSDEVLVLPFGTGVVSHQLNGRDSLMTIAKGVSILNGGGTNLSVPVGTLLNNKFVVDTFIGITDTEEWQGMGFLHVWRDYLKEVNPNAQAFLITIAPYGHRNAPQTEKGVHFISGWSDSVLQYISNAGTQVDIIRQMEL